MKSLDHVILGALLHDVGKLLERGDEFSEYRDNKEQWEVDCYTEKTKKTGQKTATNYHSLHSRHFCEWLSERVTTLRPDGYSRTDKDADHWINLAAKHHRATTPLQRLLAAADHFSSGERERIPTGGYLINRKSRLESIIERIRLSRKHQGDPARKTNYRLPLCPFGPSREELFPVHYNNFSPPMEKSEKETVTSPVVLTENYKALAGGLKTAMEQLSNPAAITSDWLYGLVRTLLGQLERFTSAVPSATNIVHPDISLFDHLRMTAAIAEGLYHWHFATDGSLLKNGKDFEEENIAKWRLVCGDFSGIQNFIFNLTAKGAAKGLRGRSLYITLMSDGIAEHLVRRLGLYPTSCIYTSGGRFYLLIPASKEEMLQKEVEIINQYLLDEFRGEIFLGLGIADVRGEDFRGGNMGPKWQEANKNLIANRLKKFKTSMIRNPQIFFHGMDVHGQGKTCDVCGRDDDSARIDSWGSSATSTRELCKKCHDLEKLGQRLSGASHLFWIFGDPESTRKQLQKQSKEIEITSIPLLSGQERIEVFLLEKKPSDIDLKGAYGHLETLNSVADPAGSCSFSSGFRFVAKWDRGKEKLARENAGDPYTEDKNWEFDDFAQYAKGIHRMGVLRLDVDDLGEIIAVGLRETLDPGTGNKTTEMGSLSRVATLSRQLHRFFSGHLQELLASSSRTQLIYAGGDDLFLVGSWDELPAVAEEIHRQFSCYCSGNPVFSLSGGLTLATGKFPISRSAEHAKKAEEKAKRLPGKNSFCMLDTPVSWSDFAEARELQQRIKHMIDTTKSHAILGRLRSVVLAAAEYQQEQEKIRISGSASSTDLNKLVFYQRWRWQLVYNLSRFKTRTPEMKQALDELQEKIITHGNNPPGRHPLDWLQLSVRWAEFLTRKEK